MTVQFVVAFPVMLVVALVAVNACTFLSECASFDNAVREAVRVHATSPAYEQSVENDRALVAQTLSEAFARDNEEVDVEVREVSGGHVEFTATLRFSPTLFSMGAVPSAFGVAFPELAHTERVVVDRYKPGALL